MKSVTLEEASSHLGDLLSEVERGEEVAITRAGREVARLVAPIEAPKMTPEEAIEGLRRLRESLPKGGPSVRELVEEIRREREA